MKYLMLATGVEIPQLGFGTADIGGYKKTKEVIGIALTRGFRRFDTASMYGNEKAIGQAIFESDLDRSEIFVTTKLWDGGNYSFDNTIRECHDSIDRLDFDYVDLYLHHWPVSGQRLESWKAMEELQETGLVKNIGVSNYTVNHLEELIQETEIKPVLNQVEFNPFLFQKELMVYCQAQDIILEAYSPFAKGKRFDHPLLVQLSKKYKKSPAQILLRWGIQHGISIIPKASTKKHIQQNYDIFDFELDDKDIESLDNINEGFRLEWDPSTVE